MPFLERRKIGMVVVEDGVVLVCGLVGWLAGWWVVRLEPGGTVVLCE